MFYILAPLVFFRQIPQALAQTNAWAQQWRTKAVPFPLLPGGEARPRILGCTNTNFRSLKIAYTKVLIVTNAFKNYI